MQSTKTLRRECEELKHQLSEARRLQSTNAAEIKRLKEEAEARDAEILEALQQQVATSAVLKVISRPNFDLQFVLDTLIKSAVELCDADCASIFQREGDLYFGVSNYGFGPEYIAHAASHPFRAGKHSMTARIAMERKPVYILDVLVDSDYRASEYQRLGGYRTMFGVPLLRDNEPIGNLNLGRFTVRPFTQRQIELVKTFADHAVIAIENARLFDEVQATTRDLSEALQQQTATSEVLKAISRSTFDLQTVLDTLVQSATELCDGDRGVIYLQERDAFHLKAYTAHSEESVRYLKQNPQRPGRGSGGARVLLTGEIQNIPNIQADEEYDPTLRASLGTQGLLGVPLMRDQAIVGAIVVARAKVGTFN